MIHAADGVDVREWRDLDDVLPEDQLLLTAVASARDTDLAAEVLELRAINEQLKRALGSRAVIDQARGMVMALTP
ncbi:hypothetical protein [Streptomyces mirabilis]|uniref:hypothetical protein n=1 Tax=Streptomyces mirabilis TaxID=68239 RepID=UPI002E31F43C|nr:hypothetical protein [Streptomyces mirabilis]